MMGGGFVVPDGGGGLEAVHARHLHVHEDGGVGAALEQIDGFPAGLGDIAGESEGA